MERKEKINFLIILAVDFHNDFFALFLEDLLYLFKDHMFTILDLNTL